MLCSLCRRFVRSARAGLLGFALATAAGATQNLKLNDPLARGTRVGSVTDFHLTADGTRVVYRADREADLRFELFSRPLDGSGPSLKLNGPMHAQGDVGVNGTLPGGFAMGAGDRVVYVADEAVEEVTELFSVPADGSTSRVRISQPGLRVYPFKLDAAKTRVVFQEGFFVEPGRGPLHVAPTDGSAAPLTLTPGMIVFRFWLSPDGAVTVFSTDAPGLPDENLFAVPTDGSAAPHFLAQTAQSLFSFVYFDDVQFTPDGLRVVYNEVDDMDGDFLYSIHSVPLDASQAAASIAGGLFSEDFVMSSDTSAPRVAFPKGGALFSAALDGTQLAMLSPSGWTSLEAPLFQGTNVLFSAFSGGSTLFRVPGDGSSPAVELFAKIPTPITSFALANPSTVVFISRKTFQPSTLSVVPLAGGTPVPLHPASPAGQGPRQFFLHPDGRRILYRSDDITAGVFELYAAHLDASAPPARLSGPSLGGGVVEVEITPDGARAVYRSGIASGFGLFALFVVPIDASAPALQLNEPIPTGVIVGDVTGFQITSNAKFLVYRADQESDEDFDLHAVAIGRPGPPLLLTAGIPSVAASFVFSPRDDRVVFQTAGVPSSLCTTVPTGGNPIELDRDPVGLTSDMQVSPDGGRVVYRKHLSPLQFELFSALLDGRSAPVRLHAPLAAGRTVTEYRISPGGVVVFRSDLELDQVFELHAVPIKGGVPVRLDTTPVPGGDVASFEIAAGGAAVVYLADQSVNERFELFSAPIDGSRAPAKRSGLLAPGGDVTDFALTPDGKRVVYRADQLSDFRFDLFSVPVEAGPAGLPPRVTRLSRLPRGRAVQAGWSISPDGAHVVYRADADVAGVFELYRAPLDGSAAPTKLSAPQVLSGDVSSFSIAPDQAHVVYLADQRARDVVEIFSVPFAGGPVVSFVLFPGFADVQTFQIAPDSASVVFLADRFVNDVQELFRAPIDGHSPPVKLNPTLPFGGDVLDFVALDDRALYRADQATNDVFELFLAR